MNEIWKPIPGYEKWYEVSSLGRVRRIAWSRNGRYGKPLKGAIIEHGYVRVTLSVGTRVFTPEVHSLVALAFIGPRPKGLHINHRNGVQADNRPENLEYCTPKENIRHAIHVLGRVYGNPGERNGLAKLTEASVRRIRQRYAQGSNCKVIAEEFGVTASAIDCVVKRKTWKHVA